jgi:hypothetical protein
VQFFLSFFFAEVDFTSILASSNSSLNGWPEVRKLTKFHPLRRLKTKSSGSTVGSADLLFGVSPWPGSEIKFPGKNYFSPCLIRLFDVGCWPRPTSDEGGKPSSQIDVFSPSFFIYPGQKENP